jgi:hypothetical protein
MDLDSHQSIGYYYTISCILISHSPEAVFLLA